mmetsp:Transcript_18895/g.42083  ORF Transcript_18895/g.42083 Transcript_18895/m.42083 type:complete len:660 (-) Transcript_18895:109-2088(-)
MLEYDNSAFYYFALTLLVIYIIPGTYFALSEFFAAFLGSGEVGSKARTKLEAEKASKLKTATTGFTRLNTTSYVTNLVCVLIAWFFFLYLMALVINDGEVNTFDPYVILGIAQGSATGEIKKAYRRLSLKYHPDKNIGDKIAEEMFMRIAKAYEALTDETSKENYEKFGNPDGKQALEVSIGLPSIILDNPKVVLVLYLISMVVVIPSAVGIWYANSKQFGEKNIMYETYNAFYTLLAETHRVKNMPEIIAASAECRAINTPKPTDNEPMGLLYGKMKSEKLMVKPKFEHATVLRGNLLMHAHLMRLTDSLNPVLLKDLNTMLGRTPELIEGLVEISHQRKWLEVSIAAIKFAQCVVQGLWTTNDSLEQLPYFGEAQVKAIAKSAKPQAKSLGEYLLVPDEEKTGLSELTEDQKEEVLRVCSIMPNLKVELKLFVEEEETNFMDEEEEEEKKEKVLKEGEEEEEKEKVAPQPEVSGDEVYEQDLVTLRVTFTRENVSEGKRAAPVYAPYFPKTVRENWWVVLTDKGANGEVGIHAFEKVGDQSRTFSHELRFMAPQRAGDYEMTLQLLSDCYQGLDQTIAVPFTVRPASELPEFQPHPEDLALDNEPTLFEQVMAANVDEESSDEEDDEEEEEIVKAPAPAPAKGSVVVEDVDDSEEED